MNEKMKKLGVNSLKELFGWIAVANAEYVYYRDALTEQELGDLVLSNFSDARKSWGTASPQDQQRILDAACELCDLYDAQELAILINSAREVAVLQDLRAYGSQHLN